MAFQFHVPKQTLPTAWSGDCPPPSGLRGVDPQRLLLPHQRLHEGEHLPALAPGATLRCGARAVGEERLEANPFARWRQPGSQIRERSHVSTTEWHGQKNMHKELKNTE